MSDEFYINLTDAWPIIAACIAVIAGGSALIERLRNNRYVNKSVCMERHRLEDERWQIIQMRLDSIASQLATILEKMLSKKY